MHIFKCYITRKKIDIYDDVNYSLCQMFRTVMGSNCQNVYMHHMQAGHFVWSLRRYRNAYAFSQVAMEASVGRSRAFLIEVLTMGMQVTV